MELPPDSVIEEWLVETFPNARLRELARATGLIQRERRKLKADALFWSLAIGFLSGNYRTLEEFRQACIETYGGSLSYPSFHDWFMPALCEFLREALKRALEDLKHENDRLQGRFEQFREIFIADMTVITLYQLLFDTSVRQRGCGPGRGRVAEVPIVRRNRRYPSILSVGRIDGVKRHRHIWLRKLSRRL